ncbi:MAG: DUF2955 domain-containing protein [Thiohalomonadales bacterium]
MDPCDEFVFLYLLKVMSANFNIKRWKFFCDIRSDPKNIRIMRFTIGVTLAVTISSAINWPLAFLVPILSAVFLTLPIPNPGLRVGLTNMLYTLSAFALGSVFTLFLLPFPLVYVPMLGLILFNLYYMLNRGASFWLVLMSILALLILPMLGNNSEGLAFGFASGFIFSGWATVIIVWLAYFIVPDQPGTPALPKSPGLQRGYSRPAAKAALKSTAAVLPIVVLMLSFNMTNMLLVMVFTAMFIMSPEINKGKAAGVKTMKSALIGGMFAFVFYSLIIVVPEYHFFIVLMLVTTLVIASNSFSDKPNAMYYASCFSTFYILVNSSQAEGADFSSVFITRLLLILLATVYVVFSLIVFEHFWPSRETDS